MKDLSVKKIQTKFRDLISLDEDKKTKMDMEVNTSQLIQDVLREQLSLNQSTPIENKLHYKEKIQEENQQLIFTKSDICKEVAKLKPYLKNFNTAMTTVEKQDLTNKEISDDEKNCMSDLIIYLNKKLCQKLRDDDQLKEKKEMWRQKKEKEGWVYEVFYRFTDNIENMSELNQTTFKNGYIVLTEILELFANLTFDKSIVKMNINEVKRIKYFEENEYQIIDIRFNEYILHIGFLNEVQSKLFDRMLFLIRNMARTSTTRLFQNQLMKNIYSQF